MHALHELSSSWAFRREGPKRDSGAQTCASILGRTPAPDVRGAHLRQMPWGAHLRHHHRGASLRQRNPALQLRPRAQSCARNRTILAVPSASVYTDDCALRQTSVWIVEGWRSSAPFMADTCAVTSAPLRPDGRTLAPRRAHTCAKAGAPMRQKGAAQACADGNPETSGSTISKTDGSQNLGI